MTVSDPDEPSSGTPGDSPKRLLNSKLRTSLAGQAHVDPDRGVLVGVAVGLAMLFSVQALLIACLQLGARGEGSWLAPLGYAGFTQLIYVAPTILVFVNRKCPKMALGAAAVAAVVFMANMIWFIAK